MFFTISLCVPGNRLAKGEGSRGGGISKKGNLRIYLSSSENCSERTVGVPVRVLRKMPSTLLTGGFGILLPFLPSSNGIYFQTWEFAQQNRKLGPPHITWPH